MSCRNHAAVAEVVSCERCGADFCDQCLVAIGGRLYCADCKIEQLLDVRSGLNPDVPDYASIVPCLECGEVSFAWAEVHRGECEERMMTESGIVPALGRRSTRHGVG